MAETMKDNKVEKREKMQDMGVIKTEVEVLVKRELLECALCVSRSPDCFDMHITCTKASGTTLLQFLAKFTQFDIASAQNGSKYLCRTCYDLINMLENAELEYFKLKQAFETILSRSPLFGRHDTYVEQPMRLNTVKVEVESDNEDFTSDAMNHDDSDDEPLAAQCGMKISIEDEVALTGHKFNAHALEDSNVMLQTVRTVEPVEGSQTSLFNNGPSNGLKIEINATFDDDEALQEATDGFMIDKTRNKIIIRRNKTKTKQTRKKRLNHAPKTAAERGREFRARQALIREQNRPPQEPPDLRTIQKRAMSAERTRRWRERKKGVSEPATNKAKIAAKSIPPEPSACVSTENISFVDTASASDNGLQEESGDGTGRIKVEVASEDFDDGSRVQRPSSLSLHSVSSDTSLALIKIEPDDEEDTLRQDRPRPDSSVQDVTSGASLMPVKTEPMDEDVPQRPEPLEFDVEGLEVKVEEDDSDDYETAYNPTVTDQPGPMYPTDLPLPSTNNVPTSATESPTMATRKTKAQKQREYRQRIAATRTAAEAIAKRKLDAERQRNHRLRKAVNSAFVSGSIEFITASSSKSKKK